MSVYAIQNKKTGKFVSSIDILSGRLAPDFKNSEVAMLFATPYQAELYMNSRECGEQYQVVEVEPLKVVEGIKHE